LPRSNFFEENRIVPLRARVCDLWNKDNVRDGLKAQHEPTLSPLDIFRSL
jgi:hypothetical protein